MTEEKKCLFGGIILSLNKNKSILFGKCLLCGKRTQSSTNLRCRACGIQLQRKDVSFKYKPAFRVLTGNSIVDVTFEDHVNIIFKKGRCVLPDMDDSLFRHWASTTKCSEYLQEDMRCICSDRDSHEKKKCLCCYCEYVSSIVDFLFCGSFSFFEMKTHHALERVSETGEMKIKTQHIVFSDGTRRCYHTDTGDMDLLSEKERTFHAIYRDIAGVLGRAESLPAPRKKDWVGVIKTFSWEAVS
ncbi:MAG: uncharacterized protein A8A55_0775 [Amphiamblys sp. WSBS2006]|nr:MAG: uncharacterized protein A8A55_0775 [Amphiamblys sp. WSBS2006]